MCRFFSLIGSFFFVVILFGCNTLYNTKTINIEIAVPASIQISPEYKSAVVRYNNSNVAFNPFYAKYFKDKNEFTETTNLDSIASEIYFQSFVETVQNQFFFDPIKEIESFDYSDYYFVDSLKSEVNFEDTLSVISVDPVKFSVSALTSLITDFQTPDSTKNEKKYIDSEYALYSKNEIQQIADTTGADILFSLDYFAALDGINFSNSPYMGFEAVYIISFWNIYDLQRQKLLFFYDKMDTVIWEKNQSINSGSGLKLPKREDAVLNAAEIAGSKFAEFLVPHWIEVQRMYYQSGNVELQKTEKLIEQGEWLKAAEIWKANIKNKNKNIAAKSMFNLALANEMEGNLDAAIDWAVKSFHVFGNKNKLHYINCTEYLRILAQRKLDFKKINIQMGSDFSDPQE